MNRLVGEIHEKRRVAWPIDEPLDVAGQKVGGVALVLDALSVDVQRRVDCFALAGHRHPMVEARARAVVVAHVPLAEEAGAIAGLLQFEREHRQRMTFASRVVDDAVRVRILAGQETGPARRAQRRRGERVGEARALAGQPVHVRRLDERMSGGAKVVPAHVVDQDEDDVGASGWRRGGRRRLRSAAARYGCRRDDQHEQPDSLHRTPLRLRISGRRCRARAGSPCC
jgi:hypothetical protein